MKIIEVTNRTSELIQQLLIVWEGSVKATHLFLSDEEIKAIKQYVPQALEQIPHLIIAESETGLPVGFMGVADEKLEMLFVSNNEKGKGVGKELLTFGMKNYAIKKVDVNEQNPLAKGFYEHLGFAVYDRSELDDQGNPYPILHMKKTTKIE